MQRKRNTYANPVTIEGDTAWYWGGPFSNFTTIERGIVVPCDRLNIPATRFFRVENAYQACKAIDVRSFEWVADAPTGAEAKRRGNRIILRDDWPQVKTTVMLQLCRKRLEVDTGLHNLLVSLTERGLAVKERDPYWGERTGYIWSVLAKEIMAPTGCDRCGTEDTGRFNDLISDVTCIDCLDGDLCPGCGTTNPGDFHADLPPDDYCVECLEQMEGQAP